MIVSWSSRWPGDVREVKVGARRCNSFGPAVELVMLSFVFEMSCYNGDRVCIVYFRIYVRL